MLGWGLHGCAARHAGGTTVHPAPDNVAATEPAAPGKQTQAVADRPEPTRRAAKSSAARIYGVAEGRVANGRYAEAVGLLRQALLQLPETPGSDKLRHQLILRLAYVQMRAHEQTHAPHFVDDAEQMLEHYAVRHEALFGDGEAAEAERADVYEMLYTVQTLRETVAARDAPPAVVLAQLEAGSGAQAEARSAAPVPEPEQPEQPEDTHAGEPLESESLRRVRVRRASRLASSDDPRVQQRLQSEYAAPIAGLVLTDRAVSVLNGPRGLVRMQRAGLAIDDDAKVAGSASRQGRQLARALLVDARPALQACYEAAHARRADVIARMTVHASVEADGTVSRPRVEAGGLIDGLGDACVIEALGQAQASSETKHASVRVRMPLVFFFQQSDMATERQPQVAREFRIQPIEQSRNTSIPPRPKRSHVQPGPAGNVPVARGARARARAKAQRIRRRSAR